MACLATIWAAAGAARAAQQAPDTPAILALTVNGVEKGAVRVLMRGDMILLPVKALTEAGIVKVPGAPENIGGEAYVESGALAPGIKALFDRDSLALALTVDPRLLNPAIFDLGEAAPAGIEYVSGNSGFVNYALTAGTATNPSFLSEQGWSLKDALFDNLVSVDPAGQPSRVSTSLIFDNRADLTRWTLGDTIANAGTLGGAAQIAGLSYGTNFGINPYFTPFPNQRFAGTVATPSIADIYVNGLLARSVDLAPGPFNLQNIPAAAGAGNVQVVVRNAFGQSETLGAPYYLATQLLKPGLSNFSYTAGAERDPQTTGIGSYSGPAFMAYHQYGLTDWASPGAFAAGDSHRQAAGPEITLGLPVGTLGLFGAVSQEDGFTGDAGAAQYSYQTKLFSAGVAVTYTSPQFATLDLPRYQDREVTRLDLFGSVPWDRTNFTLDLSDGHYRDAGKSEQASLTASNTLTDRLGLNITLSHAETRGAVPDNGIFVALTIALGKDTEATASVNRDHYGWAEAVQAQKSLPIGEGYGYLAQAATGPNTQDVADLQYQGAYGLYEIDATRAAGLTAATGTVSGSLVAIGDRVIPARPIQDAYGLVRVPGVEGVTGTVSHQDVGKTDGEGDLLVPNLLSYYGNQVGIDDHDVPMDYEVGQTERIIAPSYRGGAVIEFPVHRLQAFQGTLAIARPRGKVIPTYGELAVTVAGKTVTSPVGSAGEFFLDSLPPGLYPAAIAFEGQTCRFTLKIPKARERVVQLGEQICAAPP